MALIKKGGDWYPNSNQKCLVSASVVCCRTWPWSDLVGLMQSAFEPLCQSSSHILRRNSVCNPSCLTMVDTDDSYFSFYTDAVGQWPRQQ